MIAPHPLARLAFETAACRRSRGSAREGEGFRLAMRTLDVFRASVGAAAVGFARRALDLGARARAPRRMFGGTLAERDLARAKLGTMATRVDAAALLVYRAAWLRDVARRAHDGRGGDGEDERHRMGAAGDRRRAAAARRPRRRRSAQPIERLYREIRALRIYEGATEVQQLIVGKGDAGARTQTRDVR